MPRSASTAGHGRKSRATRPGFGSRARTPPGWPDSTAARRDGWRTARWGFAWPRGHTLRDRELDLPRAWTDDPDRLQSVGLAPDTPFVPKPELARRMREQDDTAQSLQAQHARAADHPACVPQWLNLM